MQIHQQSDYRYGYRPMYEHLQEEGVHCGRDRTRRLMKELSIQMPRKKRFKPQVTNSKHLYGYSPNLIKELDLSTLKQDEVWVADTTYMKKKFGWVYLAVIMDLHILVVLLVGAPLNPMIRIW